MSHKQVTCDMFTIWFFQLKEEKNIKILKQKKKKYNSEWNPDFQKCNLSNLIFKFYKFKL